MDRSEDCGQVPASQEPRVEVVAGRGDLPSVVIAVGEFDDADAGLTEALAAAIRDGDGRVVVDMIAVTFINSAVIRALLVAQAQAAQRSGWLRLAWTNQIVGRVIDICGLAELFPQHPTVAAALADCPAGARYEEPPT